MLLVAGCGTDTASKSKQPESEPVPPPRAVPAAPALDERLFGDWKTEPTPGQLGVIVIRQTFRADGTFHSEAELQSAQPTHIMSAKGTYRVDGDQIRFHATETTAGRTMRTRSKYAFDGEQLVITDQSGDVFTMTRQ